MTYYITPEIHRRASKRGLIVQPSRAKNKKIDVFRGDKKIASIGDIRYPDFHIYLRDYGKEYAEKRRYLYWKRHENEAPKYKNGEYTPSYLARVLLW